MGSLWGVGQRSTAMLEEEVDEEMVCQHCEEACWLKEDPCAMAEMKKRMEGEATVERDSLEAFFLRLLLLDNIKQEAQEEAKSTGPKESETDELSVGAAQNGHFKPRQPRPATPLEEEIAEGVCCRCGGTVYRAELSVEAGATTALASLVSHATGLWMLCECLMGLMERLIVQTAIDKGSRQTTADQLGLEARHRSWPGAVITTAVLGVAVGFSRQRKSCLRGACTTEPVSAVLRLIVVEAWTLPLTATRLKVSSFVKPVMQGFTVPRALVTQTL